MPKSHGIVPRAGLERVPSWRYLRMFDRPVDEQTLGALLKSPEIPGLTESLTDLRSTEWQTLLAKLRRARLLAGEDPHNPGHLDAHPLLREYFGEQLRSQRTEAWKECNRRLFNHYRALAPPLPDSFREMEPLFLAVICGARKKISGASRRSFTLDTWTECRTGTRRTIARKRCGAGRRSVNN